MWTHNKMHDCRFNQRDIVEIPDFDTNFIFQDQPMPMKFKKYLYCDCIDWFT